MKTQTLTRTTARRRSRLRVGEAGILSNRFRQALKDAPLSQHRLATACGIYPTALSKMLAGAQLARHDDTRLTQLAILVGCPVENIFEDFENE